MNIERAAMKGKLAAAKENRAYMRNKAEALATAIRMRINTAITDIEDIRMDELSPMWSDLEVTWAEILSLSREIDRLDKDLA
jgi:hypothetical protein